uniref:Retrotransposon Copia-like N-terminal domain-containing protein n=1 Tax=Cannabis sativa TaxID=3483 RepID=A0A803PLS7_CANSA
MNQLTGIVEEDNLKPVHSSPDPPVSDNSQLVVPAQCASILDHLAHEDVSIPFFLSTADHPRLILLSTVLNGANYQSWKRGITIALTAKNKFAFMYGYRDKKKFDKGKSVANNATASTSSNNATTNSHVDLSTQCQQLISLLSQ